MAYRISEEEYEAILAKEKQSGDLHESQRLQVLRLHHAADSHSEMTEQPDTMVSGTQSIIPRNMKTVYHCFSPNCKNPNPSAVWVQVLFWSSLHGEYAPEGVPYLSDLHLICTGQCS